MYAPLLIIKQINREKWKQIDRGQPSFIFHLIAERLFCFKLLWFWKFCKQASPVVLELSTRYMNTWKTIVLHILCSVSFMFCSHYLSCIHLVLERNTINSTLSMGMINFFIG
ncbi:hypothetical protein CFOL_v3_24343, partial [Cephalotus follicularis]